jgi:hypothetical protein
MEKAVNQQTEQQTENQQPVRRVIPVTLGFIRPIPDPADAAAALTLQAEVSCEGDIAPGGRILLINGQGESLADTPLLEPESKTAEEPAADKAELTRVLGVSESEDNEPPPARAKTAEFTVNAPAIPGDYTWTVRFIPEPAAQAEGPVFAESSLNISFTVRAHLISLSVWGVPIPVNRGQPFKISVGAACSVGCALAGLPLRIQTENGPQTAALGSEILPHTRATSWAEVELAAPDDEAVHHWTVSCEPPGSEHPHYAEPADLTFRTAGPPQHNVTITVVEKHDKTPLSGAYVMVGLRQAESDKQGIARLKTGSGAQLVSVILRNYITYEEEMEINADTEITVPLTFSPIL